MNTGYIIKIYKPLIFSRTPYLGNGTEPWNGLTGNTIAP